MRALAVPVLLVPVLAAAADLDVPSRIDAVTVYRSSARVTRAARLQVPAGASRLVLAGLPDQLDDDSIRVDGSGAARARVFGVTVERVTSTESAAAEARVAEERLQRLQEDDRALEDRIGVAKARLEFVTSLRSTYSEERARNLAVRGVRAREWAELAAFVQGEQVGAREEIRRVEAARREHARKIAQARAELEKVQAKRATTTKTVAVELEADRGGVLELAVSYVVHAAGWAPIWDARLLPEAGKMELSFLGSVWQRTGEDWRAVTLSVSTAEPARGLLVPQLDPIFVRRAEPPRPVASKRASVPRAPASEAAELESATLGGVAAQDVRPIEVATAAAQEGLLSATFTAPRRESVDGAGRARKVPLARFPLAADIVRVAAPRVAPAAFLVAKATNETGFPLLAGMAGVYVGDEFAGRAPLPATPPGGEIELAFGADDRVEIERKVLERRRESAGLLTKDEVLRYRVRIAVKNRYAAPVAVRLLDLVPVSADEKIRVEILDGTTALTREDPERPGVRIYELPLAAREERVVELRYEVRYPRGFPVAGLD